MFDADWESIVIKDEYPRPNVVTGPVVLGENNLVAPVFRARTGMQVKFQEDAYTVDRGVMHVRPLSQTKSQEGFAYVRFYENYLDGFDTQVDLYCGAEQLRFLADMYYQAMNTVRLNLIFDEETSLTNSIGGNALGALNTDYDVRESWCPPRMFQFVPNSDDEDAFVFSTWTAKYEVASVSRCEDWQTEMSDYLAGRKSDQYSPR